MDNISDSSVMEQIRERIKNARQSRVDSAMQLGETDSTVLQEQSGIDREARSADMTLGDKASAVGESLVETSLAGEIGEEVGQSISDVSRLVHGSNRVQPIDFLQEAFQLNRNFDPEWNPYDNDDQWKRVQDITTAEGLDPESNEALFLATAGSERDLMDRWEEIRRTKDAMRNLSDAGGAAQGAYFAASMLDADMFIGAGIYSKLKLAKRTKMLDEMVAAGKLTADEAKAFVGATSRLDNMKTGAIAGATGATVGEAGRVALSPEGDIENLYGALLVGTTLGSTVGAVLPTNPANKIAKNLELKRAANYFKERDFGGNTDMNKSFRFTEEAEGGFADVRGDRGGATMQGISSKYFPEQFKELKKLVDSGNVKAARRYRRAFYKKEFYDKVVDPKMTTAQKQSIYDAAVHHGVSKAKSLYKEAGGDVNKMLQLREDFMRGIVKSDPSQEKFLDGWLNRVNNLREDVRTSGGFAKQMRTDRINKSVGAAAQDSDDGLTASILEADDWADEVLDENPILDDMYDHMLGEEGNGLFEFVDSDATPAQRISQQIGEQIYRAVQKTPLRSDFDMTMGSSKIGRALAFKVYEDPLGRATNNKSADAVATYLHTEAANVYAPRAEHHINRYVKDNDLGWSFMPKARDKFNKDLTNYRADVNAGVANDADWHPSIIAASNEIDEAMKMTLNNLKKYGVEGFEDVEFNKGYVPRRWEQSKFDEALKTPGVTRASIAEDVKEGLLRKSPDMDEQDAFIYARAVVDHLDNNDTAGAVGLGTLNSAGEEQLYRTLERMGYKAENFGGMSLEDRVKSILYKGTDRGTAKSSRRRLDIDMTVPLSGTNMRLIDLTDQNVYGIVDQAIRGQSNLAGLASVGLQQRDKAKFVAAARSAARVEGKDPDTAAKAVENIFGYFDETAFMAGQGQYGRRAAVLARLAYLPQLGITQAAEIGVAMGVVGMKSYTKFAGKSIQEQLSGTSGRMMDSMGAMASYAGDHRLVVHSELLDDLAKSDSRYLKLYDKLATRGTRAMGYLSGFYKANELLHTWTALSMNDYVVKAIRDGADTKRLRSMGVDDEYRAIVQQKINDGSIKFDDEGYVSDMGMRNWSEDETMLHRIITRRNMDQVVQKPRRGDGHAWMYTEMGSLLGSLKSYVFTAINKQLVRGLYHGDKETAAVALSGLLTAGMAYSAKQLVNGNTDNLTPEKIAIGAINWSSMVSPAMMVIDPMAYALGLDKVPGSPVPFNDWRYGSSGILSVPALNAANDLIGLGRLPADVLDFDGELDRVTEKGISAIPVLGRSYPMSWIMDTIESIDEQTD